MEESVQKLKVGLLGLEPAGRQVLQALRQMNRVDLCAVADEDREAGQTLSQDLHLNYYDDLRQMIVQETPHIVFVCIPTYQALDQITVAARQGAHIVKLPPLGRTVPEAQQILRAVEGQAGRLFILSPLRQAVPFIAARQFLQKTRLGRVYLVQLQLTYNYDGPWGWRADPGLAGGGVLLERGYEILDVLNYCYGIPERVYTLKATAASRRVVPPYRTEDTAVLTLSFADGAIGQVLMAKMAGPQRQLLRFYGTEASLEIDNLHSRVYDPAGEVLEESEHQINQADLLNQNLETVFDALAEGADSPLLAPSDHLPLISLIEAAYLSSRTGMPEPLKEYRL